MSDQELFSRLCELANRAQRSNVRASIVLLGLAEAVADGDDDRLDELTADAMRKTARKAVKYIPN